MGHKMDENKLPGVSVIVPVFNDEKRIEILLRALLEQEYPKDRYEILIVDNKSTDRTRDIVQKYPVRLLEEKEFQSSYAARNRGIQAAAYDLIAFTDSDCRADPCWLSGGVKTLLERPADLAAGQVRFTYYERSAAEIYDSICHLQSGRHIQQHQSAPTANLFVQKRVIDQIGSFPVVESGGDLLWTRTAVQHHFRLEYAEGAVVYHPARSLGNLLKKRLRTGRGSLSHWKQAFGTQGAWWRTLRLLLPRRPSNIKKAIRECGQPWMEEKFWSVWLVAYLCNLVSFLGILQSLLSANK